MSESGEIVGALATVEARVKEAVVKAKSEVAHVIAVLEPKLQEDLQESLHGLAAKMWQDVLATVRDAMNAPNAAPQNEQSPDGQSGDKPA